MQRSYTKGIMRFHFLAERMKIGKVKTLITNLRDKERYVEHIFVPKFESSIENGKSGH